MASEFPSFRLLAFLSVSCVVLAGCVATDATPASSTAPVGQASVAAQGPDVGTLEGVVTDGEVVPIAGATVALVQLNVQVKTAQDGAFRFDNVPPGKITIIVEALGYESTARAVEVRTGETNKVNFALLMVAVQERYLEVFTHTFTIPLGAAGPYGDLVVMCRQNQQNGCIWTLKVNRTPQVLVVEIDGRHSVPNPNGGTHLQVLFGKDGAVGGLYSCSAVPPALPCPLPMTFRLTEDNYGKKVKSFNTDIRCEYGWFCLDDKYHEWMTLFHGYTDEEVPETYTARPPS